MKRIIFTVTNDLQYDQRMQRICTSLAKTGYDCTLVGRLLPNSKPLPVFPFRTHRIKCYFTKGKLFYLEYNLRLFFYLMQQKTWAICAIDLDTLLPATLVSRVRKNQLVYDAHEYFTEVPEVVNRKRVKAIWEWVAKTCIPKADLCYTVGPKLADILGERYKTEFSVVRNLPIKSSFEKEKEKNDNQDVEEFLHDEFEIRGHWTFKQSNLPLGQFILYQGALNEGRGLEELIEASMHLPVPVIIAGEGDLSQTLRDKVKEIGAGDVKFLGFIKPPELKAITSKAWLGYNLLENKGLSYYYSLANKFFDYANAGVPCLNSDFPEYKALNEQYNCSLQIELTKDAIVEAVQRLLDDESQYKRLSENSKKMAAELNWENEEKELIKLYEQL